MRATLEAFHRDEVAGSSLLRALVGARDWVVPVSMGGDDPRPLVLTTDRGRWWQIFTSPDALRASREVDGAPVGPFITTTGTWVFGGLPDDLDGIDLDPNLPHAVHFRRHQFKVLRRWSQAIRVEALLHGANDPEGFALLRRFDGYRVVFRLDGGRPQMVLAPDTQRRSLAAIFTAEDNLRAFMEGPFAELGVKSPRVVKFTGDALFAQLARMQLDGLVFNCSGPVPPKAVAHAFCRVVLGQ